MPFELLKLIVDEVEVDIESELKGWVDGDKFLETIVFEQKKTLGKDKLMRVRWFVRGGYAKKENLPKDGE